MKAAKAAAIVERQKACGDTRRIGRHADHDHAGEAAAQLPDRTRELGELGACPLQRLMVAAEKARDLVEHQVFEAPQQHDHVAGAAKGRLRIEAGLEQLVVGPDLELRRDILG